MTIANNPFEIMGLERLVETQEADYIGKAALEEDPRKGVDKKLVGIEVEGDALPFELAEKRPAPPRTGDGRDGHRPHLVAATRAEHRLRLAADRADRPRDDARDRGARRRALAGAHRRDPVPRLEEGHPESLIGVTRGRHPPASHLSPPRPDEIALSASPIAAERGSLLPVAGVGTTPRFTSSSEGWSRHDWVRRRAGVEDAPSAGTYFTAEVA